MKTNYLLFAFAATVTISSCTKEEITIPTTNENTPQAKQGIDYVPDLTDCFTGVDIINGTLRFSNANDFRNTLNCLRSKTLEMEKEFLDDWGHLSDSLLDLKQEEIGYNEELVFQEFENNFGYASLRHQQNVLTDAWLNATPFDTSSAMIPDHVLGGKDIQTVFTDQGVINVDDTLLHYTSDGNGFYILNGDFTILDSILTGTWSGRNSNVEVHWSNGSVSRSSCKASKSSGWKWKYNSSGSYGMKYKAGFYNILWVNKWYGTTESYKRKNGKYKAYKQLIDAAFDTNFYSKASSGDCGTGPYPSDDSDQKKKKSLTVDYSYETFRMKSGDHWGGHYIPQVSAIWHSVTW